MKNKSLFKAEWYQSLIDDLNAVIGEGIKHYRETLLKTYYFVGKRISQEKENFTRSQLYGQRLVRTIAKSLGKSETTIKYAILFYEKFPKFESIYQLPEGQNISWSKIVSKYLPKPKECKHLKMEVQMVPKYICADCGKTWYADPRPPSEKKKRQAIQFPRDWYWQVIAKYQELKGIELKGEEFKPVHQDIKTMFMSERTPVDIIRCMEWLNQKDEEWKENWNIGTVKKKMPEFLAKKDKPQVGYY